MMEWVGFALLLGCAAWVYSDAKERGSSSPALWATGVILLWIVFFPLYLIMRPKKQQQGPLTVQKKCPHCGTYFEEDANFCPNCGNPLKDE